MRRKAAPFFLWTIVSLVLVFLTLAAARSPKSLFQPKLLFWIAVVAVVELLPVPVSREIQFSLGFPVLLAVSILYPPHVAATVALLGSFDPRELRGQISLTKALYNRSQVALSTSLGRVVPSAMAATAARFVVNVALVSIAIWLLYESSFPNILRQLLLGTALMNHLLNYLGLGFFGIIIARLYSIKGVEILAVAAFILPLIFARQMFFRALALEAAHKELKDRQRVLKALSNRMAEERQDERMRIAAYLHDDLAQMLFRLNLQAQMAKKRLTQGDTGAVGKDLDGILQTKQETSDAIRALIRDLHRSPIGRRGLAEEIQSFADDMTQGGGTSITTDVVEVSLPPPIQLLIYQIAREASMNALKHAEAKEIRISLTATDDGVLLTIADDGKGFDTSAPPPEGHFGSVMMRERALVAGGDYSLRSEIGKGTTITATFPRVWVEEGSELEATERSDDPGGRPSAGPPVGTRVGPPRMGPPSDRNGQGATEVPAADSSPVGREAPHSASKGGQAPAPVPEEPATPDPRVVPA